MGLWEQLARGLLGGHRGAGHGGGHGSRRGHDSDFGRYGPVPGAATGALICQKCGGANAPEARFCSACANPLTAGDCTSCGATMAADARFCAQCGRPRS